MPLKVVLDTNCIISALLFSRQNLAWLRQSWQTGDIAPIVNKATVTELMRMLTYPKFNLSPEEQHSLLADFLPYTHTVARLKTPLGLPQIRDPHDQLFLNLAVGSHAEALVTGDDDLLTIKHTFTALPIMTLREFQPWLVAKGQE